MAESITIPRMGKKNDSDKKPAAGKKANREGRAVTMWLAADVFGGLEQWRKGQEVPPIRTKVIQLAIIEFLRARGIDVPEPEDD